MQSPTHLQNFAVVIPAFNEAATIRDIASRALVYSPLVIIIDDGSTDSTKAALEGLPVTLIEHKTNQGKAASLWDGITAARAHKVTYIVTLDGDGQHAPEDIPLLLAKTKTYPNHIVIGARLADKSLIPAKRYWANRIANFWIAWAAGYPISDSQSGFRVYPSHLFNDLTISTSKRSCFVFESEILIKAAQRNIKSHSVPIPAVYAKNARPSHFRGGRDITFITLMVARYLIIRGMYPQGLYRSCIKPHYLPQQGSRADFDGYLTLAISVAIIILTLGSTLLLTLIYVLRTAIKSGCTSQTRHLVVLGKQLHNNLLDHDYRLRLDRAKICYATNPNKLI